MQSTTTDARLSTMCSELDYSAAQKRAQDRERRQYRIARKQSDKRLRIARKR